MDAIIEGTKNLLNEAYAFRVTVIFSGGQEFSLNGLDFINHLVFVEGYEIFSDGPEIGGFSLKNDSPGFPEIVLAGAQAIRNYAYRAAGYKTGLWPKDVPFDEMNILNTLVFAQAERYPCLDDARFNGTSIERIHLEKKIAGDMSGFNDQWQYVYATADHLAVLGEQWGVKLLSENLLNSESTIRRDAAWALGFLKDSEALAFLIGALDDEDAAVRRSALDSIVMINSSILWINSINSKNALEKALTDEDLEISQKAEVAIRRRDKMISLWD